MSEAEAGTFDRADVQAWIDSLDDREAAMLAHVVGDAEYRAAVETLREAAEWAADLAREHGNGGKRKASRAVREVVGVLLRAQRAAAELGAKHAGQELH